MVAEDADDDRQPDRRFSRGNGHDEDHEHLPGDAVEPGQRDEGEIHGVEHELDAHENDDRVAACEHADHADDEQNRGEKQRFLDHVTLRLARTTAPTMAARSSTLVISNASRYSRK